MDQMIESVEKYPCLWNRDTKEYNMKECKDEAWRNVIKECNIPNVEKAKKNWKLLKHYCKQWLKTNETITNQDDSVKNILEKMKFLIPHIYRLSTNTTYLSTSNESQINTAKLMENEEMLEVNESDKKQISNTSRNERKYDKMIKLLENAQEGTEKRPSKTDLIRQELLNEESKKEKYMDTFFRSMCEMSFGLPEILQMKIERQVFNSVMEAREKNLQKQTLSRPSKLTAKSKRTAFKKHSRDKTSNTLFRKY